MRMQQWAYTGDTEKKQYGRFSFCFVVVNVTVFSVPNFDYLQST